jgi:prepilin-type N-terminal cleavage/methylation domain-containing protein
VFATIKRGFTLIELLIVVAIIAILAAIAVPNFLEAQTRSKVSRAKADMRSLATALEAYFVDYNAYPLCNNFATSSADPGQGNIPILERLSTPVAYMTSGLLPDPFLTKFRSGTINPTDGSFNPTASTNVETSFFKYLTPGPTGLQDVQAPITAGERAKWYWILQSNGPDLTFLNMAGMLNASATEAAIANNVYDPTNGTVSRGSVFRIGGQTTGREGTDYGARFYRLIQSIQR